MNRLPDFIMYKSEMSDGEEIMIARIKNLLLLEGEERIYRTNNSGIVTGEIARMMNSNNDLVKDVFKTSTELEFIYTYNKNTKFVELLDYIRIKIGFLNEMPRENYKLLPFFIIVKNNNGPLLLKCDNLAYLLAEFIYEYNNSSEITTALIFNSDAGDVFRDDGLRY